MGALPRSLDPHQESRHRGQDHQTRGGRLEGEALLGQPRPGHREQEAHLQDQSSSGHCSNRTGQA